MQDLGLMGGCFAVFGKHTLSGSRGEGRSLHGFWEPVLGGLIFKVYMQEKLYPFNRIFFCISRVSAVL